MQRLRPIEASGLTGRSALPAAGLALVTVPAVALTHLLVSGSAPPAITLLLVAAGAVLIGVLPARSLTGQFAGAQLLGHLVVYLSLGEPSSSCLPAMGRGAALGLRLAVLRQDPGCAPGQYTAGPVTITAATAVLLLAGGLLVSQCLIAAGGSLVLRAAQRAWVSATALFAAVALALRDFVPVVVTRVTRRRPADDPDLPGDVVVRGAHFRRGPPAFSAA